MAGLNTQAKSKLNVGVIGCGNISGAYLGAGKTFPSLQIMACSDLDMERARAKAAEFAVPRACTVQELIADPEIDIVINLTVPRVHAEVDRAVLEAGKSVYSEKPLAVEREDGRKVLELAASRSLRVGCAPDTFMGGGLQMCRKIIDEGGIGEPIGATAFMAGHGMEMWHPDPDFFYQAGAGPMFDMGVYYLTALVSLLGPIRRVTGSTRITFPERTITSQPRHGQKVKVTVPTHIAGVMDFDSGAIGTILTSFDVWAHQLPRLEIYGSEGSLSCPDPNGFGGPVRVRRAGDSEWSEVPLVRAEAHRGIGVADMALAMELGRPHRASGELALHVLDIMQSFHEASDSGQHITLSIRCTRPEPLPASESPADLG